MKISCYTGGMVATNGYFVETPDGNFMIDAPEGTAEWIKSKGLRVDELLLTHQHYDHVQGVHELQEMGIKVSAFAHHSTDLTLETAARDWGKVAEHRIAQADGRKKWYASYTLYACPFPRVHRFIARG